MSENNISIHHAGLDVAKATLQFHLRGVSHALEDTPKDHAWIVRLLAQAEADAPAGTRLQVVLEATGGNEAALVAALHAPTPPASAAPRSLRPVEDAVAAAFAGRFYEDARQSPRDEALCRTQMDCMENNLFPNGETDTAEACCWACFTLAGQPERLRWR